MGAEAAQQLHGLQQVGFPFSVGPHHQQLRGIEREVQLLDVAEVGQLQALQPDGSQAANG
jgi:hypothetical protein